MHRLLALGFVLLFVSCASNAGVIEMGGGSYFVSRQAGSGFEGLGTLKAAALKEAAAICSPLQKSVAILSENQSEPPYIVGNFPRVDLTFRCA